MRALAAMALIGLLGCERGLQRMTRQERTNAYSGEMRPAPEGTRARAVKERSLEGLDEMKRGESRYRIFCSACHGLRGDARTVVASRMDRRPPASLLDDERRKYDTAALEDVVANGHGYMPSYAHVLSPRDRRAVARYVKALQLSQGVPLESLPPALRHEAEERLP